MRNAFLQGLAALVILVCNTFQASAVEKPYEPFSGQAGKDVVWVPTPQPIVELMLDVAQVGQNDFVMDLGSGDGRNVIAAARRGAHALGVEYNPEMVAYSLREAQKAGVEGRARFVQGDMYEADLSQASVLALFLLTENLDRLAPKFLELRPGTRIVVNTFAITDWAPDITFKAEDCTVWCEVLLYIVPAKVAGDWQFMAGRIQLDQTYQVVSGSYIVRDAAVPLSNVTLRGDRISFRLNDADYHGIVEGDRIRSERDGAWTATRVVAP